MDNDDPPMPEFFLMDRLGIHQGLVEERAEGGYLVKTNDTVVGLNFLQRTQHRCLVPDYINNINV
jgi:hypothetical protein